MCLQSWSTPFSVEMTRSVFRILLKDPLKDPPCKKLYPLDAVELAELKEQIDK